MFVVKSFEPLLQSSPGAPYQLAPTPSDITETTAMLIAHAPVPRPYIINKKNFIYFTHFNITYNNKPVTLLGITQSISDTYIHIYVVCLLNRSKLNQDQLNKPHITLFILFLFSHECGKYISFINSLLNLPFTYKFSSFKFQVSSFYCFRQFCQ